MAMTSPLRHPPAVEAPSRAALRKQRLLEMENEQRIEDAEALKFTEEQRLSLLYSFRHVKFEWSDLDGMRSMRRCYQSPPPRHGHTHCHPTSPVRPSVPHSPHSPNTTANTTGAFAVLTNARLASFNPNETICVRSAMPPCPSTPAPTSPASLATSLSIPPPPASPSPTITSFTPPTITTTKTKIVRTTMAKPSVLSTRRRRSPVKGLFPAPQTATPRSPPGIPIRVPAPPLSSLPENEQERQRVLLASLLQDGPFEDGEEDEETWVDLEDDDEEEDDEEYDDEDEDEDEDDEEFTYDGVDGRAAPLPALGFAAQPNGEEEEEFDESALPTPVPGAAGGWRFAELPPVDWEVEL